jgi:hypothetical protein
METARPTATVVWPYNAINKYDTKACPWRMAGHTRQNPTVAYDARCIKDDCLAWDITIGCRLIEKR